MWVAQNPKSSSSIMKSIVATNFFKSGKTSIERDEGTSVLRIRGKPTITGKVTKLFRIR